MNLEAGNLKAEIRRENGAKIFAELTPEYDSPGFGSLPRNLSPELRTGHVREIVP
jgi:hypothetical protein